MIRVQLVDDHPVVRSGYLRLLELTGDIVVVAEGGDTDSGYTAFVEHAPDVLVSDLSMPGGGGLALMRRALQRAPDARILVFSMHDSPTLVRRALEAGARGFVTKASAPECLVEAVRKLRAGGRFLSPDLPPSLLRGHATEEARRLAELSAREFELFRLLAQGCTVEDCATALKLSPKTVSNHQTVIREKLGVATSAAFAHLALGLGVIPPGAARSARAWPAEGEGNSAG